MSVKAIPDGYPIVSPNVNVKDARACMQWIAEVLGGTIRMVMPGPSGAVMHGEVEIRGSVIMFSEAIQSPPHALDATYYTEDVDALVARAVEAGAKITMPIADMFWGDRCGAIEDPFGNRWFVMTHKEDLTPEQIGERAKAAMGG